jgi:hypothetical protein
MVSDRPGAELRPLHKTAIRMAGVLQNLPEGHFTQRGLYRRSIPFRTPTAQEGEAVIRQIYKSWGDSLK